MQEPDDIGLLRQYVEQNSEEAFAALVSRHVNKVYSVALRHTSNPHQAEEITQAVFVTLAKKAPKLGRKVVLSGWLYETSRLMSLTFIRGEIRRARREQEAHMQNLLDEAESDAWLQIRPLLDAAMSGLSETDRLAVVLRFFDGKSMKEVGMALGASEDAAKMRLSRAVEKLRGFFTKRGVVLPAAVLTASIAANSVQAAPATLAKSVTSAAIAKGAAFGGSTLTPLKALKLVAWTKTKTAVVIGGVCLLVAGIALISVSHRADQPFRNMPADWSVLAGNPLMYGLQLRRADMATPGSAAPDGTPNPWHWANGKITIHDDFGDSLLLSGKEYGDFTMSVIADAATREASLAIRMQDEDHGYILVFCPAGTAWSRHNPPHLAVVRRNLGEHGHKEFLATFRGNKLNAVGHKAKIDVTARGPLIEVKLNGTKVLEVNDDTFLSGRVGFRAAGDPPFPCDATFSELTIH